MNAARKKKWSRAAKTAQAIWEGFRVADANKNERDKEGGKKKGNVSIHSLKHIFMKSLLGISLISEGLNALLKGIK